MTWTGQTFSVGQILTAAQMNNLQADITALANGDSGAPKIQDNALESSGGSEAVTQATIRAGNIGQPELKTTTGSLSTVNAYPVQGTLAGGEYGFYPQGRISVVTYDWEARMSETASAGDANNTSFETHISFGVVGVAGTAYVQQRYMQSSPPNNLGDGEILLFHFVVIDNNTGLIESTYVAPEAPWHYNGPTNIKPDYYEKVNGVLIPYRRRPKIIVEDPDVRMTITALYATGRQDEAKVLEGRLNNPKLDDKADYEIDQSVKNADMDLIPHPFMGNDLTGKTVILLDPVSKYSEILLEIHEANANDSQSVESIAELIHNGKIKLGSEDLIRSLPSGIISREIKF